MTAPDLGSTGEDILKRAPMAREHGLPILLQIGIAIAVEDLRHFPHGPSPSGLEIGQELIGREAESIQGFRGEVRIACRGSWASVAQDELNHPQIDTVF